MLRYCTIVTNNFCRLPVLIVHREDPTKAPVFRGAQTPWHKYQVLNLRTLTAGSGIYSYLYVNVLCCEEHAKHTSLSKDISAIH
jgi:hypothetical protein